MTDPWEDIRKRAGRHLYRSDGEYRDVFILLRDADALLAVVPKLEFLAEIRGSFCIYPDKEIEHVGAAVVRKIAKTTLAALPEHLKEKV